MTLVIRCICWRVNLSRWLKFLIKKWLTYQYNKIFIPFHFANYILFHWKVKNLVNRSNLLERSRMNGDVHVRFWIGGWNGNICSTVTLSHPGAVSGSKGLAVRQWKRYVSWVQTVVRQVGPYLLWAHETWGDSSLVREDLEGRSSGVPVVALAARLDSYERNG